MILNVSMSKPRPGRQVLLQKGINLTISHGKSNNSSHQHSHTTSRTRNHHLHTPSNMRTSVSIAACAVGLASLVQYCPAPPLAAIIGITTGELVTAGTTLAGSAIAAGAGAGSKRDIPAGVSQESVDQCISSLAGVQINFVPQDDGKRIPDRLQILVAML
jgi:hypothetical protein